MTETGFHFSVRFSFVDVVQLEIVSINEKVAATVLISVVTVLLDCHSLYNTHSTYNINQFLVVNSRVRGIGKDKYTFCVYT